MPHELRDRAAHRVPDRDEAVDAQRRCNVDGVIGALLQAKRLLGPQSGAVAAMVEGDHPVPLAEPGVATEPVEVGSGGPTVEQHDCRGIRHAAEITHHDGTAIGEFDEPCRWQHGGEDVELVTAGVGGREDLSAVRHGAPSR